MNYNYGIIHCDLSRVLKARGQDRKYLAKHGITYEELKKLEQHKSVSLHTIIKICSVLNCQPGTFLKWVPPELMGEYLRKDEFNEWLQEKKKEGVDISRYQSVSDEEIRVMLETIKNQ